MFEPTLVTAVVPPPFWRKVPVPVIVFVIAIALERLIVSVPLLSTEPVPSVPVVAAAPGRCENLQREAVPTGRLLCLSRAVAEGAYARSAVDGRGVGAGGLEDAV